MNAGDLQEEDPVLRAKSLAAATERRDDLRSRLDQLVVDRLGRGQTREARKEGYLKSDLGIAQVRVDLLAAGVLTLQEVDARVASLEGFESPALYTLRHIKHLFLRHAILLCTCPFRKGGLDNLA